MGNFPALTRKGLPLRRGSIVDATSIAAPSWSKNAEGGRDHDMHQAKKGAQWHFGMKAHTAARGQQPGRPDTARQAHFVAVRLRFAMRVDPLQRAVSRLLAKTINGLYKAELIRRKAPWKNKESLELVTLEWMSWFIVRPHGVTFVVTRCRTPTG